MPSSLPQRPGGPRQQSSQEREGPPEVPASSALPETRVSAPPEAGEPVLPEACEPVPPGPGTLPERAGKRLLVSSPAQRSPVRNLLTSPPSRRVPVTSSGPSGPEGATSTTSSRGHSGAQKTGTSGRGAGSRSRRDGGSSRSAEAAASDAVHRAMIRPMSLSAFATSDGSFPRPLIRK